MPRTSSAPIDTAAERARFERRLASIAPGARVEAMLRLGAGSRPDVAVVELDGARCVVKDHQGCDPWFARFLGPMLARREARALARLDGVPGVPSVLRMLDRRAVAMAFVNARPYRQSNLSSDDWSRFFGRMTRLVDQMHARGVAHCDLRSPDNTLITPEGEPVVVDFVASYVRGARWNVWSAWLFGRLCEVDRSAIDKQKRTVSPELLAEQETKTRQEGLLERSARNFGVGVRHLARALFTRHRDD